MTAPRPATSSASPPERPSLWRQVSTQVAPEWTTTRYIAIARTGPADPAGFTGNAREDVARLATALAGVLDLHTHHRRRCEACSAGLFLVDWPCRTRRAIEHGLRHGWPIAADLAESDDLAPGPYEGFALAVLAAHDILPAAGGQPARCRTCHVPPGQCPVWALADGFLGITWTDQPSRTDQAAAGAR